MAHLLIPEMVPGTGRALLKNQVSICIERELK
jgi:hypothetical protein